MLGLRRPQFVYKVYKGVYSNKHTKGPVSLVRNKPTPGGFLVRIEKDNDFPVLDLRQVRKIEKRFHVVVEIQGKKAISVYIFLNPAG